MRRLRRKTTLAVLGVLAMAAIAFAFWTTSGSGTGSAATSTLDAAVISAPATSSGSHAITWTQQATTGDAGRDTEITYKVERKLDAGSFAPVADGPCSGDLPHGTTTCTDSVNVDGTYTYRVVAEYRTWTATSNEASVTVLGSGDTEAPNVDSIDRAGNNPTNSGSVSWTVTFDENVNGVHAADFQLVEGGGVSGSSITSVTPSSGPEDVWTVTANMGSGNGTLGLNLVDDDSIQDNAGNKLGGTGTTGPEDGSFTGQVYDIDKTAPTVQSIDRDGSQLTNSSTVSWTVTFSEDVSHVGGEDFALAEGSGLSGSTIATVVQVNASTYTLTANTGAGDGNLGLNLVDDDSIEDDAGNKLGGAGTSGPGDGSFTGQTYHVDKTGPSVQSIARDDPDPTNAGVVHWTVTFDDNNVQGVNDDFSLHTTGVTGAAITDVTAITGATYTVTASTGSGDGTIRLDLVDNDSITDQLGNPLGGVGTSGAGDGSFQGVAAVYTIDRTAPTVQSINRAGTSPTNASSVQWTVTFSENVSGVNDTDFALAEGGGVTGSSITTVTGNNATYTVTANTGSGSGTLGLNLDDDDSIEDAATNKLGGTGVDNGDFTGEVFSLDKNAPTVQSIDRVGSSPTNATSVQWTVTFSENVTGVGTADFSLVRTGGLSGGTVTSVTPSSGPEDVYTVTASTGTGSGTLGLNAADDDSIADGVGNKLGGTGNGNGNFTGQIYAIDKTAPTVQSIDRADASPTNATSVSWTVTFSEDVTGVNAGDFSLVQAGGVSGASITSVTPSSGPEDVYTVTANTGSNSGTLGLNLVDNNSIVDGVGNPLGGPGGIANGNFTGQVYAIDKTAPTVQSINRVGSTPSSATSVQWTVTFSENVTGVDSADFALAEAGGVSGASITNVTGSNSSYTVTASTGSGEGTLGLNLVDDDSITDGVGNKLGGTGNGNGNFTGQVYAIDKTAPSLTKPLEMFDVDKDGKVDQVQATFNETLVSSTATAPWTLTDVPSNGSLASVGTAGTVATLTITEGAGAADTTVGAFKIELAAAATGIRDAAGNQSSFAASAPTDKAAPAPLTQEMFDTEATPDGKVDQAKVTFSENLQTPYTAPNTVWTLGNAPGGASNTLNSVGLVNEVATLTLNEGNVNTSAGQWSSGGTGTTLNPFTLLLTANAGGIRDAAGNQTSWTPAKNVTDKAKPIPTSLTFTPSSPTSQISTNDRVAMTFSEPLAVASMCGPTWSGNTSNQSLDGNDDARFRVENNTAPTTNFDKLVVQDHPGGACGTTAQWGSIDLGRNDWVSAQKDNIAGTGGSSSDITWTFSSRTLTWELGTVSPALSTVSGSTNITQIYTPDPGMTDIPGNTVTGTISRTGTPASTF